MQAARVRKNFWDKPVGGNGVVIEYIKVSCVRGAPAAAPLLFITSSERTKIVIEQISSDMIFQFVVPDQLKRNCSSPTMAERAE